MRILFIDIDALRSDHLGSYEYLRETSPNINEVAKKGIRFCCSDAPCLPSRGALFTGKFSIKTGLVGQGGTSADIRKEVKNRDLQDKLAYMSLPTLFKNIGFHRVTLNSFRETHSAGDFMRDSMRFITIFLKVLFDNWERDLIKGKYISIRLFDNLVRMIGGYPPQACEMNGMCSIQNVIEADGSVYPCDFYVFEKYKLRNINQMKSMEGILKNETAKKIHCVFPRTSR